VGLLKNDAFQFFNIAFSERPIVYNFYAKEIVVIRDFAESKEYFVLKKLC